MLELLGWLCHPAHFLDKVGLQFDNTISVGAMAVYRCYASLVLHTITNSCTRLAALWEQRTLITPQPNLCATDPIWKVKSE